MDLKGTVGNEIKASVTIEPQLEYPFKITEVSAKRGKYFSYKLEEVKKEDGLEYLLHLENTRQKIGRYHDTLILKTDSEVKPAIEIRVSGNIKQKSVATINPKIVHLKGSLDEPITAAVTITPITEQPLKILDVTLKQGKNISYKLEETEKAGKIEYILHVENLKKEAGRYQDTIVLSTDSKIRPEINIRVYANIMAQQIATISPVKAILFGPMGKEIETSVNINPKNEYPFNIVKTEAQNGENISFKLEKVEEAEKVRYVLHVKNLKKDLGHYTDTIILQTDNNIQPEIKIGVSGNIHSGNQKDLRDIFETLTKSRKKGTQEGQD